MDQIVKNKCPVCAHYVMSGTKCPHCGHRLERYQKISSSGWILAGACIILLIALGLWSQSLESSANKSTKKTHSNQPLPDGTSQAAEPVSLFYGLEKCIPWHVSAAAEPPSKDQSYIVLTSKISDPFGLVLSGFEHECSRQIHSLVLENLSVGELTSIIDKINPTALVTVGKAAFELAQKEAPQLPILFSQINNPLELGLNRPGLVGVSPWVPIEPLVRHILMVLPKKETIGIIVPQGSLTQAAQEMDALITEQGRKSEYFEVSGKDELDSVLKKAVKLAGAWIVLPDREIIGLEEFNRIQIVAEDNKIPIGVPNEELVRRGALVGAGPDSHRIGQQLCRLAGAWSRKQLPDQGQIFCPEYTFAVISNLLAEKLGYQPSPGEWTQAKLYKWH
jgi:ABC-type uncharacterized transport system substrate-binding protein